MSTPETAVGKWVSRQSDGQQAGARIWLHLEGQEVHAGAALPGAPFCHAIAHCVPDVTKGLLSADLGRGHVREEASHLLQMSLQADPASDSDMQCCSCSTQMCSPSCHQVLPERLLVTGCHTTSTMLRRRLTYQTSAEGLLIGRVSTS